MDNTGILSVILAVISVWSRVVTGAEVEDVYPCDSPIYCHGALLDAVQRAQLFPDSKTFVDMPMKHDQDVILGNFKQLNASYGGIIPPEVLRQFVEENFDEGGYDLVTATLHDFQTHPKLYYKIRDVELRKWSNELNHMWKDFARKVNTTENNTRSSSIYVPKTFVVPGGRFREFYNWDTYWIVGGLLICEMKQTVRGIIENLLSTVQRFGFVPNGGRVYYTRRTQPPMLIPMMHLYHQKSKDLKFLKQNIKTLEEEYLFWQHHRTVRVVNNQTGRTYGLARYRAESNTPRPEGYMEDVKMAESVPDSDSGYCDTDSAYECEQQELESQSRHELLQNIASAAESGWDFSTRWMRDHKTNTTIMTQHIIPVDLNAMLCANERLLSELYGFIGDVGKETMYRRSMEVRRDAIHDLLWNESFGIWYDYDLRAGVQRQAYYASNFVPLYAGCVKDGADGDRQLEKVLRYIKSTNLTSYLGGVPSSLAKHADEQWDFPNAWPPSVHMLVTGLADTGNEEAEKVALILAQNWIASNYKAWQKHAAMFEKYDAEHAGRRGGGGEYGVQQGFGWTNGVVLMLLDRFGGELKAEVSRGLLFGLTMEVWVCIIVIFLVLAVILAGSLTFVKKRHDFNKHLGENLSSSDSAVRYSPVNTNPDDNHADTVNNGKGKVT